MININQFSKDETSIRHDLIRLCYTTFILVKILTLLSAVILHVTATLGKALAFDTFSPCESFR